jgi:hypothetical protein
VNYDELYSLSHTRNFEILRDRKYGDVPHINQQISDNTKGVIDIYHGFVNLENITKPSIIVLELSEDCPLNNIDYRNNVMERANKPIDINYRDDDFIEIFTVPNIIGYVSQHKWWKDNRICFTPGVKNIEDVQKKKEQGADFIIVGRMVLESEDPVKTCQEISNIFID